VTEKRESEIASLERNIGTGASQLIIENRCCHDFLDHRLWWSIEYTLEADEKADVAMAVRYLELCSLLQWDASNSNRV
jgi:hypothetical protein